jgi:hypothetical protein
MVERTGGGTGTPVAAPSDPRQGWPAAKPATLPRRRTAVPAAAALGIVLIFFGVVTAWLVALVGVGVLAVAVAGWIGEIRYDLSGGET